LNTVSENKKSPSNNIEPRYSWSTITIKRLCQVTDRRSDSKEFQTEYIQSSKYAARQVADIKPYLK
jgi:hypothetical protein